MYLKMMDETNGGLAQLGERLPCKQEVSGSIPLISTKEVPKGSPLKPSEAGLMGRGETKAQTSISRLRKMRKV